MDVGLVEIGETFEGYEVLALLGKVGLGERYRVRRPDGGEAVLDVVAVHHPELLARLQEARLHRVEHPNLVSVHEVVPVLRFPGLVSDDGDVGVPLLAWLQGEPPLEDREAVLRGLVAALDALHGAGLSHGFLEPEAVWIAQPRFGEPVARLGLPGVGSVLADILGRGGALTTAGGSTGSAGYRAPELQGRPGLCDPPSDLFSLGCLLYLLYEGEGPFDDFDPVAALDAARREAYPRLERAPPEAATLIRELLHADPMARPTAAHLVDAVDRAVPANGVPWLALASVSVASLAITSALVYAWTVFAR
ncbi:MAG: hypothetical protein R3F59_18530 [Myxococcota bacterium]